MDKQITSRLGFGLMRLPMIDGEIDMPQVMKMVDTALENGVNYFDTAYGYHDGKSETVIREALVKRYQIQLDYYAEVLEKLLSKPIRDVVIYSFYFEKEIKLQKSK